MPYAGNGKSVDDLLIDGETVIAVDNIVWPKYILFYDFSNPYRVKHISDLQLPNNGTYESISKGSLSGSLIALLSSTIGRGGGGRHITISEKNGFSRFVILSQYSVLDNEYGKIYDWRDVLMLDGFVFISSGVDGVDLLKVKVDDMLEDGSHMTDKIRYFNPWQKELVKILVIPNDTKNILLVFKTAVYNFEYVLVGKAELIALFEQMM
ncbi:MAG: hypothetical protein EOP48_20795 [Sphingobacteriales bacterium]|nr:MAG: hypothetical protein EOP48_20795 [Sphingobacteriales bacterium]